MEEYDSKEILNLSEGVGSEVQVNLLQFIKKYGLLYSIQDLLYVDGIDQEKFELIRHNTNLCRAIVRPSLGCVVPVECKQYCEYLASEAFKKICIPPRKVMLFHANMTTFSKNLLKLENLVDALNYKPDVICISETNNNSQSEENKPLQGYVSYHSSDQPRGAVIHVKDSNGHRRRDDLDLDVEDCENVWVELSEEGIIVGVIYSRPSSDFQNFQEILKVTIEKINKEGKVFYVLGDMNVDMLERSAKLKTYCDMLKEVDCKLLITKPTRVNTERGTGVSKALMDHIYTNEKLAKIKAGIFQLDTLSDHYPIFCAAPSVRKRYTAKIELSAEVSCIGTSSLRLYCKVQVDSSDVCSFSLEKQCISNVGLSLFEYVRDDLESSVLLLAANVIFDFCNFNALPKQFLLGTLQPLKFYPSLPDTLITVQTDLSSKPAVLCLFFRPIQEHFSILRVFDEVELHRLKTHCMKDPRQFWIIPNPKGLCHILDTTNTESEHFL